MAKQTNTDVNFPGSIDGDLVEAYAAGVAFATAYTDTAGTTSDTLATETGLGQGWIVLRLTATTDCFVTSGVTPTALAISSIEVCAMPWLSNSSPARLRISARRTAPRGLRSERRGSGCSAPDMTIESPVARAPAPGTERLQSGPQARSG